MIDVTELSFNEIKRIIKKVGIQRIQKIICHKRTLVIKSIDQSNSHLIIEWISEEPINTKELMMYHETEPIYYEFKVEILI